MLRPQYIKGLILSLLSIFVVLSFAQAQEAKKEQEPQKGPPPAIVVVEEASSGIAEPMNEFVGTVYYSRVSEIAAEVAGKVTRVNYDEGHRVKQGQTLVTLGSDLLSTNVAGTRASFEQALIELERARKDLARMETLFKAESISESLHDEHAFRVRSLEKQASALEASLRSLELQMEKTVIKAGFPGIVVSRTVEPDEWVNVGGTVAVIANDSFIDVVVDVPAETLDHMRQGREIDILAKGKRLTGAFTGFIPRGDVATRTFSIKLRLKNAVGLIEGMEARAILPVGRSFKGILISRDGVINKFGQDVVFALVDGAARMIPIKVLGYQGMKASVSGPGLESGMLIVVKGNERIRDGQPLKVQPGKGD